ncbi:MAG: ABC transporter permease DevC [Candidatus Obscuribacterales bacterium]|nr:ABC transporter permease DevC [Candidatus Obscuribacterales bacterium]
MIRVRDKLAWLLLTRQKMRLLVAVAGIAFACILIFMQLGFLESLFLGATRPHDLLLADIVLAHPKQQTFFSPKSFPKSRVFQARALPEVESVSSVRLSSLPWRNPENGQHRMILVFGVDPAKPSFALPAVNENLDKLKLFRNVLFDEAARLDYGNIKELLKKGNVDVELNKKSVRVAGLFKIGASFAADGTVITSDTTFPFLVDRTEPNTVELGLVRLRPGTDAKAVKSMLERQFGSQVAVYTKAEFAEVEKKYWAEGTGIGFIFGLGVLVGFLVGVVIVYQILHSDVADHLPEYATLKAIGYNNEYLLRVVFQESIILSIAGFLPGYIISLILYQVAQDATSMPVYMTAARAGLVFVMALVMCTLSASIALRKLSQADPAEVF